MDEGKHIFWQGLLSFVSCAHHLLAHLQKHNYYFCMFFLFFLFVFFFKDNQASLKDVFILLSYPRFLKIDFHLEIFFFNTLGLPQEVLNPKVGLKCLMEFFTQVPLFLFFSFFSKSLVRVEVEASSITITSLFMLLINSYFDKGFLQTFNLYPLTSKGIPSASMVLI